MSSTAIAASLEQPYRRTVRPNFFGTMRGELFKVSRMWSTWITLVMLLGAICLPYLVSLGAPNLKDNLSKTPLIFYYDVMELNLSVLRIFIGFFLLILTANVFGREYSLGTIRILLARGVGRLQLLGAKLLAVVLIALVVFLIGLLLNVLLSGLLLIVLAGNFDSLKVLDSAFGSNTWLYLISILVSMGVTILMAMAVTVVGRSLSFGLSAALAWFPADNLGVYFLFLGYRLTKAPFWNDITAYLLGPNLNLMPSVLIPAKFKAESLGITPMVKVDSTHTLLVALVYALVFAAVAVVLTWKRDVKE